MPKKENEYIRGDLFILPNGHNCMVLSVNERGWPNKVISLEPSDDLGKIGWFKEDDDWVIMEYDILRLDIKN